jgi:hypothetical protein
MVKSSETDNKSATETSYTVSYRIVIVGEAHTFEETLVKLCAMELATCVLREQSKKKLLLTGHLYVTVKRRLEDLLADTEKQLLSLFRWN